MNLTPIHYAVLRTIARYQLLGRAHGVTGGFLVARLERTWPMLPANLGRILAELSDSEADPRSGPLIYSQGKGERVRYLIAGTDDWKGDQQTGGYAALAEARQKPLAAREKDWINRKRWPSTAKEAGLERTDGGLTRADVPPVAIPTGSTKHGLFGGRALGKIRNSFARSAELAELIATKKVKRCRACERAGRMPFVSVSEFGRRKSGGLYSNCRRCEAERQRDRRRKRKRK